MAKRKASKTPANTTGRFAYEGLDRVIHEKARLGIVTSLAAHADGLAFNDLKRLCDLTDGNLSRHLAVLADAGLIESAKQDSGGRPQSIYRLTREGRDRFLDYLGVLQSVLSDAQAHEQQAERSGKLKTGWSPA